MLYSAVSTSGSGFILAFLSPDLSPQVPKASILPDSFDTISLLHSQESSKDLAAFRESPSWLLIEKTR